MLLLILRQNNHIVSLYMCSCWVNKSIAQTNMTYSKLSVTPGASAITNVYPELSPGLIHTQSQYVITVFYPL